MRLTEKTDQWSNGQKIFKGKYKKCDCTIYYSVSSIFEREAEPYWYFTCSNKDCTIRHNSLWSKNKYKSKEECHDACIKYIDDNSKKVI